MRVEDKLRPSVDGLLHVIVAVDDHGVMATTFGGRVEHVPHHRHTVDVEQQLLRTRHARALSGRQHDPAHREQRGGEPFERRSCRADPLHLDTRPNGDFGEFAQLGAVAVDQQEAAPHEAREVGNLLG